MTLATARKNEHTMAFTRLRKDRVHIRKQCCGVDYKGETLLIAAAHAKLSYMREHGWVVEGTLPPIPQKEKADEPGMSSRKPDKRSGTQADTKRNGSGNIHHCHKQTTRTGQGACR